MRKSNTHLQNSYSEIEESVVSVYRGVCIAAGIELDNIAWVREHIFKSRTALDLLKYNNVRLKCNIKSASTLNQWVAI